MEDNKDNSNYYIGFDPATGKDKTVKTVIVVGAGQGSIVTAKFAELSIKHPIEIVETGKESAFLGELVHVNRPMLPPVESLMPKDIIVRTCNCIKILDFDTYAQNRQSRRKQKRKIK